MKTSALSSILLAPGILATVTYTTKGFNILTGEEFPIVTVPLDNATTHARHNLASGGRSLASRAALDVSYSGNWCGAVQNPPSGSEFVNVYGEWNVVDVSLRSGQNDTDNVMLCQWVGIDGTGPCDSLIQVGQFSQIDSTGSITNWAFWEFIPLAAMQVNLPINTGDVLAGNVTMTDPHGGTMELINYTQGLGFVVTVSGEEGTLCGHSAEWILEDPTLGNSEADFANFTRAVYSQCSATTSNGTAFGLDGATDIYLEQGSLLCQAAENRVGNLVVENN